MANILRRWEAYGRPRESGCGLAQAASWPPLWSASRGWLGNRRDCSAHGQ